VAIVGTVLYATLHGWTVPILALAGFYFLACGVSVTGGYHRLFSHATYEAHPALKAFYLIFGAAAFENSALKWASDHRRHHAYVDEDYDPYNIKKGFWWAHMGWVFFQDENGLPGGKVGDLERDWMIRLQHRFYVPVAVLMTFGVPLAFGFLVGDPWGGLIVAGFLRLVLLHHMTFCINSVAHLVGSQPYSDSDSSRDSILTAAISLGEGYHNYHHTFSQDYRNGVGKFQLDPTKWWIYGLSLVRVTKNLVRTPEPVILKARLRMQARRAEAGLVNHPHVAERLRVAREKLEVLLDRWNAVKAEWAIERARLKDRSEEMLARLKREIRDLRDRYREAYALWLASIQNPALLLATARSD
jgi:stearoyl-CoA desaturase (delta-9 desaturase)